MKAISTERAMKTLTINRLIFNLTREGSAENPDWEYASELSTNQTECLRFNYSYGGRKYYFQLTRRLCDVPVGPQTYETIEKYTITNFDPENPIFGITMQFDERDIINAYRVSQKFNVDYRDANAIVSVIQKLGLRVECTADLTEYGVQK
tara:strand:- start:2216 stop:2665 length:450 start_codon:yes stop_codon:yes gene_type:complete